MYYKQLEGFLRDKTAELSQQMQEIIGDIVPIYNTGTDIAMDTALMDAYRHITSIVDSWCKLVLQMELLEYDNISADVSLLMPDDMHNICVECAFSGVVTNNYHFYNIHTPIGDMDYFVYRCIVDIPNNPVQIFYRWVKEQCFLAHILIQLSPDGFVPEEVRQKFDAGESIINWDGSDAEGFSDDILNASILEMAGIQDPLNLCSLDTCVQHLGEFFKQYKGVEG
ncbi:MAG: hypothetical protein ACOCM4_15085 [Acetivibrio ethanolgignens]